MVKKLRPINSNVGRYFDAMRDINAYGSTLNPNAFATDMALARQKKQEYEDFLGKTDYSGKLKDSEDLAKLQLGLALAQRGFAAMGAQPRRGESAIGVLGRTLVAPLAGDLSTVAGRLMQQRQAVKLAEQQEERQLALSALTAATSEGKERRDLALRLLKDGTKKTAKGPFEGLKWVLEKDTEGNWQHVGENNEPVQVRQRRGKPGELFDPINVRTKLARPLEEGEVLFATLPDNLKGTDKTGASSDKVLDAGFAREIKRDPNDPAKIVFGPIVETKIVYTKDGFKQYRADNNEVITIGDNFGDYRMYEKTTSTAATKPKGVKDPEFLSKFKGMLSKIPRIRQQLDIGKRGLKFDPQKYNNNPELASGVDFPFTRQDGGKFSKKQQGVFFNNLKNAYLSSLKNIRAGQSLVDLDTSFIEDFLESSPSNLGLPKAPTRAVIPPEQITNPAAIQTRYGELAPEFQTQDADKVINKGPFPVSRKNLTSGFGKLIIMDKGLGVKFGESTKSPPPLSDNAGFTDIENRRQVIQNLNKRDVQTRLLAENLSASTVLAGKLRPRLSKDAKIGVVSEALEAKRKKLNDALNDPKGKEIGETVGKSLETLARIDSIDVKMKKSGLPGFIIGPIRAFSIRKTDMDPGAWWQTEEGKEATRELVANVPILLQLVARDLAKGTGEQRISDRDLRGIQETLIDINQTDSVNAGQLKELRRYLKNSVKHSLEYVGSYGLPERVLEQAVQLGVDVKGIQGRNEFYSPYLKDRKYAVTKQDVPSYSKAYLQQLRSNRIFGYSAVDTGGRKQYQLMEVDDRGLPIWNARTNKYDTVLVPATKNWQSELENDIGKEAAKAIINFNKTFLLKTYDLGR